MGNTSKQNTDPVWLRIKSLKTGERGEQTKLMKFCGLVQNTYNGWDAGTLKSYTKYVDKISTFYGVSADWILTGEQKEKPALQAESGPKAKAHKLLDQIPENKLQEVINYMEFLKSKSDIE